MKQKRIFKSLLLCGASILPIVTLASCSSNVSQYGINSFVSSNYGDTDKEKNKTFNDYKFNNTQVSANSKLENSNDYSILGWRNILAPSLVFFTSLINLSLFNVDSKDILKENPIFTFNSTTNQNTTNKDNENLLKEFLFASSNVLNHGRSGQIKFGFIGISTFFSKTTTSTPNVPKTKLNKDNSQTAITQDVNSVYAAEGQELTVGTKDNEKSNTAYYDSNLEFAISTKLGYWYSEKNNPSQNPISDINIIKNYVNNNKSWPSDVVPSHTSFNLNLNFSIKIRSTYIGIKDSFDSSKNNGSKPNALKETTNDENKPSIEKVKLSAKDFKEVKPVLTLETFTPKINNNIAAEKITPSSQKANESQNNSNLPTVELSSKMMNDDIKEISSLLTKYDKTKVNNLKEKYKNVFLLSASK